VSGVLGEFEQLVLLALIRLGENSYGVSVQQEIAKRARREVSLGSVYKTLLRLEDKGLVVSRPGEPTAQRGGRRKKHYRILPAGTRELRRSISAIRGMTAGLKPTLELP
jgi:DNA-binding PadR family transcriptional regulator